MKKLSFKELFLPGIILFVICLVTASLLAWTNQLTAPKIEALAAANADAARKNVLDAAQSFSDPLEVVFEGQTYIYYQGFEKDGRTLTGYIFTTVTKGYGGDVKLMAGIGKDGSVSGVEILELSETPGLGMKAYDNFFLEQFLGKGDCVNVVKQDADDKSICALTGATITSNAVADAVNIALELFDIVSGQSAPANADKSARQVLLPAAENFDPVDNAIMGGKEYEFYVGKDEAGTPVGYVFETSATGPDGILLVTTAVDSKGLITGVKVATSADEPLGTKEEKENFVRQFIGKSGKVALTTGEAGENTVQESTPSSGAVVNAVNTALELYTSLPGGTP